MKYYFYSLIHSGFLSTSMFTESTFDLNKALYLERDSPETIRKFPDEIIMDENEARVAIVLDQ
jgi:hypothetical protein